MAEPEAQCVDLNISTYRSLCVNLQRCSCLPSPMSAEHHVRLTCWCANSCCHRTSEQACAAACNKIYNDGFQCEELQACRVSATCRVHCTLLVFCHSHRTDLVMLAPANWSHDARSVFLSLFCNLSSVLVGPVTRASSNCFKFGYRPYSLQATSVQSRTIDQFVRAFPFPPKLPTTTRHSNQQHPLS
jgi:hypothetical protein